MARRAQATPQGAAKGLGFALSQVAVRPVHDAAERAQWDRLMDERHYLGFRGMFGDGLRHVAAGPDGQWLALVGWCAGSFKVGARDACSAGGEMLGARRLIRELDVAGRVLTLDALHSCPNTAQLIVAKGADYVLPVKGWSYPVSVDG